MRFFKTLTFLLFLSLVSLFLSTAIPATSMIPSDRHPANIYLHQVMVSMQAAMEHVQLTGNPDTDFALMMIPHHQGAIEMAKVELLHGTDPRLRRLAQEIVVTQKSEIDVMRLALDQPNQNHN